MSSATKFTLQVMVGDTTKPIELPFFLRAIPNVEVYEAPLQTPPAPFVFYVVPQGPYVASNIFKEIERLTESWFDLRHDDATVEIRKPDGHVQVLVKSAG